MSRIRWTSKSCPQATFFFSNAWTVRFQRFECDSYSFFRIFNLPGIIKPSSSDSARDEVMGRTCEVLSHSGSENARFQLGSKIQFMSR
mmetsp:Transcript_8185/g.12013  ORF Transcript_8185/g.12013 Transcript_8185/m.12013 type:complete len:88 (+) Transcript_8185:456-719(+)